MPSQQNLRILWKDGEPLEDFQKRMEGVVQRRKGVLPYEKQRFEEGWMYIEWSRYRPLLLRDPGFYIKPKEFVPRSRLASEIYQKLEREERFEFDEDSGLWRPKELVTAVREICNQLNPRMRRFLQKYQGKNLLLDPRSLEYEEFDVDGDIDWRTSSEDVTWWLKRPN